MKSKEKLPKINKELQELSLSIGDFIRYWGFRRIHGAIWTQLYLSQFPLSCSQLVKNLGLSKALISPALEELCHYKLIEEVPSHNDKTKIYQAASNVNDVIKKILKTREKIMMKEITHHFSKFLDKTSQNDLLDQNRIQNLQEMIMSANLLLELIVSQNDILQFPSEER
jgi:DNA-binding transcriptional regulator GbsR (MarR family)